MKQIALKTNINCGSCVAKVTPALNEVIGENKWKVDTVNPQKLLTVDADGIGEAEVIKAVEKAGYKAEKLPLAD